tara:strand:- start:316 stop:666 length:351 start_codon:yes stop_codon:yes gene_type:complete
MFDDEFFPSEDSGRKKVKKYKKYDFTVGSLETFLKGEMVRPTWNHRVVESLYASCAKTEKWKDMHPDQSMSFCKCGRIALQNINRIYGNGMDIAAYHFSGLKENCIRKGYVWDSGL